MACACGKGNQEWEVRRPNGETFTVKSASAARVEQSKVPGTSIKVVK